MKFRAVFLQERMKVVVELGSELTLRRSKVEILTGIIVSNLLEVGGKNVWNESVSCKKWSRFAKWVAFSPCFMLRTKVRTGTVSCFETWILKNEIFGQKLKRTLFTSKEWFHLSNIFFSTNSKQIGLSEWDITMKYVTHWGKAGFSTFPSPFSFFFFSFIHSLSPFLHLFLASLRERIREEPSLRRTENHPEM